MRIRAQTSDALRPLTLPGNIVDETTSRKMRAVRQTGTAPEIAVRAALTSLDMKFATNVDDAPGRPDIWLTENDIPIFVHGCFWHRHAGCTRTTTPKKNRNFWLAKFKKNKERDASILHKLKSQGYVPLTVWQCETTVESTLNDILVERIKDAES